MVGFNGMGPNNEGPMTGRGLGKCGNGIGRGRGMGFGRRFGGMMPVGFSTEEKKQMLESEKEAIEKELKNL